MDLPRLVPSGHDRSQMRDFARTGEVILDPCHQPPWPGRWTPSWPPISCWPLHPANTTWQPLLLWLRYLPGSPALRLQDSWGSRVHRPGALGPTGQMCITVPCPTKLPQLPAPPGSHAPGQSMTLGSPAATCWAACCQLDVGNPLQGNLATGLPLGLSGPTIPCWIMDVVRPENAD